ncbi:MAG TPA: hypothetical protein DEB10_05250, partial [Ruminococcaceae bacterium]|nr:hypothetical protein [Oscillospiraceae bacterium]
MRFPKIWGHGSLFAFSGLEGDTSFNDNFVGTLCSDKIGVLFNTNFRRELSFCLKEVKDVKFDIVASDIISGAVKDSKTDSEMKFAIAFYSKDIVIGAGNSSAIPKVSCEFENMENTYCQDNILINAIDGEYTAFNKIEDNWNIKFAFSYSRQSKEDAVEKVKSALNIDLNKVIRDKLEFYENLPKVEKVNNGMEQTLYKCFSILKSQVYSPEGMFKNLWTTPDKLPHKFLWLWDSVFHSFGNRYISKELAFQSINAVLDTQREGGFIALMSSPDSSLDITQPPVIAWGLYDLYKYNKDKKMLEDTYDSLKRYLDWNIRNRDSNGNNLFEWKIEKNSVDCRCGESGMDNSPRFDNVTEMDCIDFSCFMANEARYMKLIADELGMSEEAVRWNKLFNDIKDAVNRHLWDPEDGFYYDRTISTSEFKKVKAVSSFLPLFAGICEKTQADSLVRHLTDNRSFNTEFSIPSISIDDTTFGTDMWRGPVWINYNYMIILGLRDYGYDKLSEKIK